MFETEVIKTKNIGKTKLSYWGKSAHWSGAFSPDQKVLAVQRKNETPEGTS